MEILQRPHPSIEGVTELVLATKKGEIHLLTVSEFCRLQAKQMRADLESNGFRYVARYVNNGGPRDLEQFLTLIDPGCRPGRTMKLEFVKGCWQFWGDLKRHQMGFCFLILDEALVFAVMTKLGVSEEGQLREFMRRRSFKAEPRVRESSRVYFRAAAEEQAIIPSIFQKEGEGRWLIPKLGVAMSIKDGVMEIVRQLFPRQQEQAVDAVL